VIHGRKFSNRTIDHIILELPLVQVYRSLHSTFKKNFLHAHLTPQHTEVNMAKTIHQLCKYMMDHSPHKVKIGWKSKYSILDLISKGEELMEKTEKEDGTDKNEGLESSTTVEDLVIELGM
ncbi:hypothetical protein PAXRUDRAFT_147505, partial [Paxillus rubicundulus Ve08.2h10]